ncbi:hypothetical protein ETAA8_04840 [Anatilimnocola aggregata]|uniref:Uncharacterized protein n=1 Tax=Anatilimnocola aggregata TaxID=2528021 RepID=A0A517Y5E2_9BACT|nr:hypothetical protein [Anatilimnocola aggregata]QDU25416.1 hypothetical protein ETAA8_04840 [Anatilimnocola aggregata]
MPTNEDLIDKYMNARGGRLVPGNDELARTVAYLKWRANGNIDVVRQTFPKLPHIHFDIFDSWDANAIAFKYGQVYFIGVSRGIVGLLGVMFDRIMGDKSLLDFLGDSSKERESMPNIPLGPDFVNSMKEVEIFGQPIDPMRHAVAQRMKDLAFDFVFAHEFAHIANGHLDYWSDRYGYSEIQELSESSKIANVNQNWVRQVIELDADRTGVFMTLSSELGKVLGHSSRPAEPVAGLYDLPSIILQLWCISVASVARLFGDDLLEAEGSPIPLYPSWRLRSIGMQRMAHRIVRAGDFPTRLKWEDLNIPDSILSSTYHYVEEIFSKISGMPPVTRGLLDATSERGWKRTSQLDEIWTKLRPDLERFAYVALHE